MAVELTSVVTEITIDDSQTTPAAQRVVGAFQQMEAASLRLQPATRSAAAALQRITETAFPAERQLRVMADAERDLDRAVRQGLISAERKVAILSQYQARMATAATATAGATSAMAGWGMALGRAQSLLATFGVTIGAASFIRFGQGALEAAGNIGELSQQLGISSDLLQTLQFAAVQSGISTQQLESAIARFTRTVGDAADGGKAAVDTFNKLGVGVLDSAGNLRSVEAILRDTSDALAGVQDPARRAALEVDLFSRSGQRLETIIAGGASKLDAFSIAAERAGAKLTEDMIASADEASDKIAALSFQLEKLSQTYAIKVAPETSAFIDYIEKVIRLGPSFSDTIKEFFISPLGTLGKVLIGPLMNDPNVLGSRSRGGPPIPGGIGNLSPPSGETSNPLPSGELDKLPGKFKTLEGAVGRARREMGQFSVDQHFLEKGFEDLDVAIVKGGSRFDDLALSQKSAMIQMQEDTVKLANTFGIDLVTGLEAAIFKTQSWAEFGVSALQSLSRAALEYLNVISGGQGSSPFGFIFDALSGAFSAGSGVGSARGTPRASGGPVFAGQSYMVGERGPERFVPRSNGTIIPNGAGGGMTVMISAPITVNGSSGTEAQNRDLAAQMSREVERSMRSLVHEEIGKQLRVGGQLNPTFA